MAAFEIPAQYGKLALVTGANSGIGKETSKALAAAGATVIMAGRDRAKLDEAAAAIRSEIGDARLETITLDLSDLAGIDKTASAVLSTGRALDLLINNAGVMAVPERRTTKDGFELTFGTNHLGHFALTGHLLPALRQAPAARVVTVSAIAFRWGSGELVDLNSEERYRPMGAYAKSKRANVVFTEELARRAQGTHITAAVVHPGSSMTGLQQHTPRWMSAIMAATVGRVLMQPTEHAAWPSLFAATRPGIAGGAFVGPAGRGGMRGAPGVLPLDEQFTDPRLGRDLWSASERMTGVSYDFA